MKYTRVIGHYNAETQAFSACAGAFQASPFTPDISGRLVGIRLLEGQEAATSLTCDVQIRVSCGIWKPNTLDLAINGGGLKTVPVAFQGQVDYPIDQPVSAGVPIVTEGRNSVATAVTVSVIVIGIFEC